LRILIEGQLDLDLMIFLKEAASHFAPVIKAEHAVDAVFEFMMERLRAYYTDRDVPVNIFEAVRARKPVRPLDFDRRIRAVKEFQSLPEALALAAANKRIGNILRKADDRVPAAFDAAHLVEPAEQQLAERLGELTPRVSGLFDQGAYTAALRELATLREPVDSFFDAVMVMADDAELRRNRLALLQHLHTLFLRAADLSRLQA
jgi:glycyl-tRNA synthetase beta chain